MTDLTSTRHNPQTRARFVRMLGLKADPFASGSLPGYIFHDQESRNFLELAANLVRASDKLVVIAGEEGSGKTTLMRELLDEFENDCQVIRINANPRLMADRLLKEVAASIKARSRQSDKLRNEIHKRVQEMTRTGRAPLLVIDNADLLSPDTLELIAELNQEFAGPLKAILFTTPGLLPTLHQLNTPIEPGSNAHLMNVRPLSIERTTDYINQRLEAAGIQVPFILTDVQIARIHKQSGGLPARINQQARKTFRSGKTIDQIKALLKQEEGNGWRYFSSDYTNRIGFYTLIGFVLAIGISIGLYMNRPGDTPEQSKTAGHSGNLTKNKDVASKDPDTQAGRSGVDLPQKNGQPVSNARSGIPADDVVRTDPVKTARNNKVHTSVKPGKHAALKGKADTSQNPETIKGKGPSASTGSVSKKTKRPGTVATLKTTAQQTGNRAANRSDRKPVNKSDRIVAKKPLNKAALTRSTAALVANQPDITGKDAVTLATFLRQNPRHYALQLYSASKLKTLWRFSRKYALTKKSVYYRINYKNKRWYIMVVGPFPNKTAASRQLAAMPEEIRANQPRIRRLFYIHRDIRAGTLIITRRRRK